VGTGDSGWAASWRGPTSTSSAGGGAPGCPRSPRKFGAGDDGSENWQWICGLVHVESVCAAWLGESVGWRCTNESGEMVPSVLRFKSPRRRCRWKGSGVGEVPPPLWARWSGEVGRASPSAGAEREADVTGSVHPLEMENSICGA